MREKPGGDNLQRDCGHEEENTGATPGMQRGSGTERGIASTSGTQSGNGSRQVIYSTGLLSNIISIM